MTNSAAITGVGLSRIGRALDRSAASLLVEAAKAALSDAGLDRGEIDGLATYPGLTNISPGMGPIGCTQAREALGLKTRWHAALPEGAAQLSGLIAAATAVMVGQARHVLVFRVITEASAQSSSARASVPGGSNQRVSGPFSWLLPLGALSACNWAAMIARRHFHVYGTTKDQLAHQVIVQRDNAGLNPAAVMRSPITFEDYNSARMISDPLCLFDCDIPIDGACAIIVSAGDAARDTAKSPLIIEAMSGALIGRDSWDQRDDLTTMAAHDTAADLWSRTDLRPSDVDVAQVYDGFSIFTLIWLEALGFCDPGEGGAFITDGYSALTGSLPTNTGGGQLSAGRMHGFGHIYEACTQLWREGGRRQVPGANIAVCGVGGGPLAGALLLRRE